MLLDVNFITQIENETALSTLQVRERVGAGKCMAWAILWRKNVVANGGKSKMKKLATPRPDLTLISTN